MPTAIDGRLCLSAPPRRLLRLTGMVSAASATHQDVSGQGQESQALGSCKPELGAPAIVVEIQRPTDNEQARHYHVNRFLTARQRNATSWRQARRGEPTRIACHRPGPRLPGTTR